MYRYDVSYQGRKLFCDLDFRGSELLQLEDPIRNPKDIKSIERQLRRKYKFWNCKITRYILITEEQYNLLFK